MDDALPPPATSPPLSWQPAPQGAGDQGPLGGWGPPGAWRPAAPVPPRRRTWTLAVLAALFLGGAAAGYGIRATAWPRPSTSTAVTPVTPALPATVPGGPPNGDQGEDGSPGEPSGSGSGSAGTGAGSATTSGVVPGVVDVNVTLATGGSAAGTGMVITSSGEVLTNNHVIESASTISVQVAGTAPTYQAHVVGYDVAADVALLQVDGAPALSTVSIGSSSTVHVGDAVVATGNALGRSGPPARTSGTVTALGQQITAADATGGNSETLTNLIQIDAPIQPGDSGGPLTNAAGQVIGMDAAAQSSGRSRSAQTGSRIAFAIPIDTAMTIVHEIEAGGAANADVHVGSRGLLGITTRDTGGSGAGVQGVQPNSAAEGAGIVAGDTVVAVDGTSVDSPTSVGAALGRHHAGDRVSVTWVDGSGARHSATVTLTAGPPA